MTYDVAVIGAGHNGLVATNYLARAGLKVIVLEARDVVGGACVTEELIDGARWSSCAFIAGLLRPEIIADLDLERHGLELYQSDTLGFSLFPDGSHMFIWKELDRTLREIERYSRRDAQRFIEFGARLQRFADLVTPWLLTAPPSRSDVLKRFEAAGEQQLFNEFVLGSMRDLLDRYFESEHLKGFLAFFGMISIWGGPSSPGTSYTYGHHSWGEFKGQFGQFGFARGGMGAIALALERAAREHGAEVRTGAEVGRVLVGDDGAQGVALTDGTEVAASAVVSNADPKRSLLRLLDPGQLDPAFRESVDAIDMRGSMARIHLLIDELPAYLGFDREEGPQHRGHQMLGASLENFERAWEAERRGEFPDEFVIEGVIQSTHDSSLAPAGQHTLTLGVQQLPFTLAEGSWATRRDEFADRVTADLFRYAPNLEGHILERHVITPLDLEEKYMITGGNIFHGAMFLEQLFDSRPLPGLADYRTPVPRYYLCGVGTHPGGGVMGASGHNAAQAVLDDLGSSWAGDSTRPAAASSGGLIARVMDGPRGRRVAYELARRPAFRPLARLAAKRRR